MQDSANCMPLSYPSISKNALDHCCQWLSGTRSVLFITNIHLYSLAFPIFVLNIRYDPPLVSQHQQIALISSSISSASFQAHTDYSKIAQH